MKLIYQIPRNSLAWLLVAQAAAIGPHLGRLPGWFGFVWMLVVLWRIQVFRGIWAFPGNLLKALALVLCGAGLLLGYRHLFGLEPLLALLVTAFILKLLEMQRKRDALVVIYLGYFVAATQFLFVSTMAWGAYGLLCVVLLTTALMGLHQSQGHRFAWRSFTLAGKLIAQCLPLMVLLFLVVPRIGALWKVPMLESSGKTGVSDTMSPGDFSHLTKSADLAFRVSFSGTPPPLHKLYWRGLVLSDFDGRTWSQGEAGRDREGAVVAWGRQQLDWKQLIEKRGGVVSYEVILEPTNQLWLYALATPELPRQRGDSAMGLTRDFRLIHREPITSRLRYEVVSYLDHRTEVQPLPEWRLARELQLPRGYNPNTQHIAQQWMNEEGSAAAYVDRVLGYFNREVTYTLTPPALGMHTADEFLWQTKRGFCEHFASSFVILMRAAGVPARVVVGYQGGEVNPLQNYLLVHQYDAHAWAEVWFAGRGWVRVDPTAAVAPQRIESSLRDAVSEQESQLIGNQTGSLLSLARYRHNPFLNALRLRWDSINYNWYRWVLNYDSQRQSRLLSDLLGGLSYWRLAILIIGAGGIMLAIIAFSVLWRGGRAPVSPVTRQYLRFTDKLARAGLPRLPGEAPGDYARRVAISRPDLRQGVESITRLYEQVAYQEQHRSLTTLRQLVRRFSTR